MESSGSQVQVRIATPSTVAELLSAEAKLQGPGVKAHLVGFELDQLLSPDVGQLHVDFLPKVQASPLCRHSCTALVLMPDGVSACRFPAGTTLATLKHHFGIGPEQELLCLCSGQPFSAAALFASVALDARSTCPPSPGMVDSLIWAALNSLIEAEAFTAWRVFPPAMAAMLLCCGSAELQMLRGSLAVMWPQDPVLVIFEVESHWALLSLEWQTNRQLLARYFDGIPGRCRRTAEVLAALLATLLDGLLTGFQEHCLFAQSAPNCCGAIALAHAASVVRGSTQDALASVFHLCAKLAGSCRQGRCYASGGLAAEQVKALQLVLQDKGVPEAQVSARAAVVIDQLGTKTVAQALQAANPWQMLKGAASAQTPMLKLVLHEELQAHIALRAASKHGAQVPNAKGQKAKDGPRKGTHQVLQVDPTQLQLSPGSFKGADGSPIKQLGLEEIVADAHGIAFCSPQQVIPFLQEFRSSLLSCVKS